MKFKITMKDPDNVYETIREAVNNSLKDLGLEDDEIEAMFDIRMGKVTKKMSKWFEYNENLTVEVDLEKDTCVVVENQ